MTEGTVIIFARTPELGRVKTRLAAGLGEATTLRLYRAFLEDSLELARRAGAEVVLARTEGGPFPEMRGADRIVVQRGEGFGARMDGVLHEVARSIPPNQPYLILGADSPHFPPEEVRDALLALTDPTTSSALGRCQEGGFYLLGFRGEPVPIREAFSGPDEASRVVQILERAGRPPLETRVFYDLDTPADLERLRRTLSSSAGGDGPAWVPRATWDVLRTLGPALAQPAAATASAP